MDFRKVICHLSTFSQFARTACVLIYISFAVTKSSWFSTPNASILQSLLFMNKFADELWLEQKVSPTICSWTLSHITALVVLHRFTSMVISMRKEQRCWKLKKFNMSLFNIYSICIYYVPLFYICSYFYVQSTAPLHFKDISYIMFQSLHVFYKVFVFLYMNLL